MCAASPISTTLSWIQLPQRIVGNVRQIERLTSSFSPARCSANSSSQNRADAASSSWSSPALRHVSSRHSTIQVPRVVSNGYACTWNNPHCVGRNTNVNAVILLVVPNHANLHLRQSSCGRNDAAKRSRTLLLTPSAATTRS